MVVIQLAISKTIHPFRYQGYYSNKKNEYRVSVEAVKRKMDFVSPKDAPFIPQFKTPKTGNTVWHIEFEQMFKVRSLPSKKTNGQFVLSEPGNSLVALRDEFLFPVPRGLVKLTGARKYHKHLRYF